MSQLFIWGPVVLGSWWELAQVLGAGVILGSWVALLLLPQTLPFLLTPSSSLIYFPLFSSLPCLPPFAASLAFLLLACSHYTLLPCNDVITWQETWKPILLQQLMSPWGGAQITGGFNWERKIVQASHKSMVWDVWWINTILQTMVCKRLPNHDQKLWFWSRFANDSLDKQFFAVASELNNSGWGHPCKSPFS